MKKVLAITVALMIAAIILMPALGFTIQSAGNQGYTAKSGDRVNYSITTEAPAHNMTPEIQVSKYSFKSPAIQSTRMAYSFKTGTATPSFKQPAVENAVVQGMKTKKPAAKLGSVNKMEESAPLVIPLAASADTTVDTTVDTTAATPVNETVTSPVNDTALGNVTVTAAINATN